MHTLICVCSSQVNLVLYQHYIQPLVSNCFLTGSKQKDGWVMTYGDLKKLIYDIDETIEFHSELGK